MLCEITLYDAGPYYQAEDTFEQCAPVVMVMDSLDGLELGKFKRCRSFSPNWFLLLDTRDKGPRHRLIPMNGPARAALQKVIDSSGDVSTFRVEMFQFSNSELFVAGVSFG